MVEAVSPVLLNVVTFDPSVPTAVNVPPEVAALSTANPVSLEELSVHVRLIWLDDAADAARLEGAAGIVTVGADVVADAVFENAELPALLVA